MADIVIAALGSHGDVAPLTGVGARLQQAGHRVTLTAYDRFASLVHSCGIGFRGVSNPVSLPMRPMSTSREHYSNSLLHKACGLSVPRC